jgi:hypothetical protein
MERYFQLARQFSVPQDLLGQTLALYDSCDMNRRIVETWVYRLIRDHAPFPDQADLLAKVLDLIRPKIEEWTTLSEVSEQFLVDMVDLLNSDCSHLDFIEKHRDMISKMKCTTQELGDLEGKPGFYCFIIEKYCQEGSFYERFANDILGKELALFYIILLKNKSKLSPFLKEVSAQQLQQVPPVRLERIIGCLLSGPFEIFSRIKGIIGGIDDSDQMLRPPLINFLEKLYFNRVKFNAYRVVLKRDVHERLRHLLIESDHPLLSLTDDETEFDQLIQENKGKIIKMLQQERELVMGLDCEYDQYSYTEGGLAHCYQQKILYVFDKIVQPQLIEVLNKALRLDQDELTLDGLVEVMSAQKREVLDESTLPHNKMFSCYINSLLLTQLTNSQSPICRLLNRQVANSLEYFPDPKTNRVIEWIAKAVKHCLIMVKIKMFYEFEVGREQALESTDQYISIVRLLHQFYYLLNVRKTIDIEGTQFENFLNGMHSESVVYDGFLAHLFKQFPDINCSSIRAITKIVSQSKGVIRYNQENIVDGLIKLNMFSIPSEGDIDNVDGQKRVFDVELILNDHSAESLYLIDSELTDYLIVMINQDSESDHQLSIKETIGIRRFSSNVDQLDLILNRDQKLDDASERPVNYLLTGIIHQNDHHKYSTVLYEGRWYHFDDFPLGGKRLVPVDDFDKQSSSNVALLMYQKGGTQVVAEGNPDPLL